MVDRKLITLGIIATIALGSMAFFRRDRDIISLRKQTFAERWCNTLGFVGYSFRDGKPYCYDERKIAYPMGEDR